MRDRFKAKVWIYQAQRLIFGLFALFALIMGPLFWSGALKDAHDEPRPQAGPPLVIMGMIMLAVAGLAHANCRMRKRPVIRCFREGIECTLVGETSLDGVPLIPGALRVAWALISREGFQFRIARIAWEDFRGASVGGLPMSRTLLIDGLTWIEPIGEQRHALCFPQVAFADSLDLISSTLQAFDRDPAARARLPNWTEQRSGTTAQSCA